MQRNPVRQTSRSWSPADDEKLTTLAANGSSVIRAAAAVKRTTKAVRARAHLLGLKFKGLREIRKPLLVKEGESHV